MSDDASLPRSAAFQWNAGGWFGGQLGGTLWMLIGGVCLFPVDGTVAGITLGAFAAVNGFGLWLWASRRRLRPHPALQALIGATGIAALGLFVLWSGLPREGTEAAFGDQARYFNFWWLLIFPGLMLMFFLRERGAGRHGSTSEPGDPS